MTGDISFAPETTQLGHLKNYAFMGLINAWLQANSGGDDHDKMVTLVMQLVGDAEGLVSKEKVCGLDKMVAYCQVKTVEKRKRCSSTCASGTSTERYTKCCALGWTRLGKGCWILHL